MLDLKNVSKFYYNEGIITSGFTKINLKLKMGEFVAITGESGSGKSTLLNVISGLDSYEEGEMYVNGQETSHYTEKEFEEYRRKYIANIFQNFNLINSYTVYQNIELGLLLNGYKKSEIKAKILDMIEKVGLTKFKNTKVSKLSGGQKQRVAIARAMVKDTPIIVADEPTGNLDTESAKDVIQILKKVAQDKLVVIVTHNIEQIEEYATRIVKMHDGRIIENREIKQVEETEKVKESNVKKISLFNKYRLGMRNTFNILSKFLLLFFVFFFVAIAVFSEYASFKLYADEGNRTSISSIGFKDLAEERIIIKKEDKTYFTNEDYEKIKQLSNIDYVIENDLFIDKSFSLQAESLSIEYITWMYGTMKSIDNFKGELDLGRMPENDNEIVVIGSKKHNLIENRLEELWKSDFSIDRLEDKKLKVVGVQYNENNNDYDFVFYVSNNTINALRQYVNSSYSNVKVLFNNQYMESTDTYFNVLPSEKVEKGTAVVDNDLSNGLLGKSIKNQDISIIVDNLYYKDELNLKISNTYIKSNFNRLTGYERYDEYRGTIFINEEEYNSLYDKPSYQSSVYVKEKENIDGTIIELEGLGIKAKKVSDYGVDNFEIEKQIIKIATVIVTIIVVFVLFFISYFIIRIILKSRNVYYTTLRMLGATQKNVKRILDIELFINSSLAYIAVLIFVNLAKTNMIGFEYIGKLTNYVGFREYLLMYVIICFMARLISRRFSKKIFKKTAINTYNEGV